MMAVEQRGDIVCHHANRAFFCPLFHPILGLTLLYYLKGCCIRVLMLREYSQIQPPLEAVKIDQIAVWKGERKMSIVLREYS